MKLKQPVPPFKQFRLAAVIGWACQSKIMKVSLKKAFSLLDGRLSTEIGDVYVMLNYIFSANLFTHQLPTAIRILQEENPAWFAKGVEIITNLKALRETDDFAELMAVIDKDYFDVEIELGTINREIAFSAGLF